MRIAIVNDTQMAAEVLKRAILAVPQHKIAWIAKDGQEAVQRAKSDTPDLILMDLIMPVMDGVEATRQIMQQTPCAILVVTSTVSGNSGKVFEAMGAGAIDAVNTPIMDPDNEANNIHDLLSKISTIKKLIQPSTNRVSFLSDNTALPQVSKQTNQQLLVIGASTGGPSALTTLLREFTTDFHVPVIITQHVDQQFVAGFADWLNEQITLPVRLALDGDILEAGTVLISNSVNHLQLDKTGTLSYCDEPEDYPHRPSVNVLFESVAKNWHGQAAGTLLTGMGRDGAAGLLTMHEKGFYTLAQEQDSCAVYGMPKAAIQLGAAEQVLPLDDIGPALVHYFQQETKVCQK